MRFGIDIFSYDSPGQNYGVGPGVYVWALLPELFEFGGAHEFFVFANKETYHLVPVRENVTTIICPGPNRFRPYRLIHEQIYLPYRFLRHKLDLIHFLGNNISYVLASKSVLTVYDLMWSFYLNHGDTSAKYRYFALTVPLSLRNASALIPISQYIAGQVRERFPSMSARVYPVHIAPGVLREPTMVEKEVYRRKYDFPFIFSVTTSMPHKNLHLLLEAFLVLKRRKVFDGRLVVAGQLKGQFFQSTKEFIRANDLNGAVIMTGYIPDQEKTYCYQSSVAFVYPSLYEGFGLPVLEAMQLGTPVIASNAASIPEVAGDACILFDPSSISHLAQSLELLLRDKELRAQLIARGYERGKVFTWQETAKRTLQVYESVLSVDPYRQTGFPTGQ